MFWSRNLSERMFTAHVSNADKSHTQKRTDKQDAKKRLKITFLIWKWIGCVIVFMRQIFVLFFFLYISFYNDLNKKRCIQAEEREF